MAAPSTGIPTAAPPVLPSESSPSNEERTQSGRGLESFKDTLASVAAGFVQCTVGFPFDTVKTRVQSNSNFNNPFHTAKVIFRDEGMAGFFKGYTAMLGGLQLINFILMPTYQACRRVLNPEFKYMGAGNSSTLRFDHVFLSGLVGGVVGSPIVCTIERLKVRAQYLNMMHRGHHEPLNQAIRNLIREQGVKRGLFTGYVPCLMRESMGNGFWFCGYEYMRWALCKYYESEHLPLHALALSGAAAGFCYWTSSIWLDTIKTTIQARNLSGRDANMFRVARMIIKENDGRKMSLFRGYSASILRSLPTAGSIIVAYEVVRRFLD